MTLPKTARRASRDASSEARVTLAVRLRLAAGAAPGIYMGGARRKSVLPGKNDMQMAGDKMGEIAEIHRLDRCSEERERRRRRHQNTTTALRPERLFPRS